MTWQMRGICLALSTAFALAACKSADRRNAQVREAGGGTPDPIDLIQNGDWTELISLSYTSVPLGVPIEKPLPQPISAKYIKLDCGYGGSFLGKLKVTPVAGPTVDRGYGLFAINDGEGGTVSGLLLTPGYGSPTSTPPATTSVTCTASYIAATPSGGNGAHTGEEIIDFLKNGSWTKLAVLTHSAVPVGVPLQEPPIPQPISARFIKLDCGYGGSFLGKLKVAPFVGPTRDLGFGLFAINDGNGATVAALQVTPGYAAAGSSHPETVNVNCTASYTLDAF